ncbi:MAG TPA: MATE family efflux transporter, partial [Opitutaceae bacterium]|nr:MATE family efflux transporter [Opitutaceae bacterium]
RRRLHLRLRLRDFFSLRLATIRRILHIGIPAAGENLSYWLSLMVITSFAARMGAVPLAAMTYTLNLQRTVILFSISLGLGTEIMIGRLIGAGAFEDAHRQVVKSVRLGLLISTGAILAVAAAGPHLLRLFTPDPAILASGVFLLRLAVLYEPGRVLNIVIINALRATGDARFPIRVAVISEWCFSVPLCFFLGLKLHWGLAGIWAAMLTEEWVRGLFMARRWATRRWLKYAERSRGLVAQETVPTAIEA